MLNTDNFDYLIPLEPERKASWRWGTMESKNTVVFDGETSVIYVTNRICDPEPGDRVLVRLEGSRAIIMGISRRATISPDPPVWLWAVVVAVSPLRIVPDGETTPLTTTPDSLVHCVVGDTVFCQNDNGRVTVMGMAPNQQVDGVDGVVGKRNLANGWTHYGGAYAPVRVSRDSSGVCYLSGLAKVGTVKDDMLVLSIPPALIPASRHIFLAHSAPTVNTEPYFTVRFDLVGEKLMLTNDSRPLASGGHVTFEGIRWIPGQ